MLKTLLVFPDGRELFSGVEGKNAIQSLTLTQSVNAGQELTPGSACAAMAEIKILTPGGSLAVEAGQELTLYRVDEEGTRHLTGIFVAEKPTRSSANSMCITAYDRVCRLDKDLAPWLESLTGWPYALQDFARMVCDACGLTLVSSELPNGDFPVEKFVAQSVTGRQLMQWIGQIACRFCHATPEGKIAFGWYTPRRDYGIAAGDNDLDLWAAEYDDGDVALRLADAEITGREGNVSLTAQGVSVQTSGDGVALEVSRSAKTFLYYQDTLSYEDYAVAPIEKVQLRQSSEDIGTVYPDNPEAVNTYHITGNYLLTAASGQALQTAAQGIYAQMKQVTYTPCKVSVPANTDIRAGDIVRLFDRNGRQFTTYIMTKTQRGQRDILECTGSATRQSTSAVNSRQYEALTGKVLHLQTDVDGIRAENKDARENAATLALQIDSIRTQVQNQQDTAEGMQTLLTRLEQTAREISATVQAVREEGATKVVTAFGVTIDGSAVWVHRSGSQMATRLDETGMQVVRGAETPNQETVFRADAGGVQAADVQVNNFLCIGKNARLEDYTEGTDTGRTACFYIGG